MAATKQYASVIHTAHATSENTASHGEVVAQITHVLLNSAKTSFGPPLNTAASDLHNHICQPKQCKILSTQKKQPKLLGTLMDCGTNEQDERTKMIKTVMKERMAFCATETKLARLSSYWGAFPAPSLPEQKKMSIKKM